MSAITEAARTHRAPEYYLRIAGVDTLFGSGDPPTDIATGSGVTGLTFHRTVKAIIPRRGLRVTRRRDDAEGLSDVGPLDVYLRDFRGTPTEGAATDPGTIFGRARPTAATKSGFLTETITRDNDFSSPVTVDVDTDFSSLSFPCLIHIGAECFTATSATSSTLTLSSRERLGTLAQAHIADPDSGSKPIITTDPFVFRGRRAVLYERTVYADGGASAWFERWRGSVDQEPSFERDGTIRVTIAPLTADLRKKLGSTIKPTKLATGYHYFAGGVGTVVSHTQFALDGELYSESITTARAAGFGAVNANTDSWAEVFPDPAGALSGDSGHPRRGRIGFRSRAGGNHALATEPTALASSTEFTVPSNDPSEATAVGDVVYNVSCAEEKEVEIADTSSGPVLKRWPEALVTAVNASTGWRPGALTGYAGAWCDVWLVLGSRLGPHLRVKPNCTPREVVRLFFRAAGGAYNPAFASRLTPFVWDSDGRRPRADRALLSHLALSYADPDEGDDRVSRLYGRSFNTQGSAGREAQAARRVLDIARGVDREVVVPGSVADPESETVIPIPPPADAFYQQGEKYILSAGPVGVVSGSQVTITLTQDGEELGRAVVVGETALTDGGVTVGYALELDPIYYRDSSESQLPSMAQYPGGPPIEITPAVTIEGESARNVLRQLFTSNGGGEVTSGFDVLSIGAGLDGRDSATYTLPVGHMGADIDLPSFGAIPDPAPAVSFAVRWRDGDTLEDLVGGILRITGYTVDISTDAQGACRLRAVRSDLPATSSSKATLTQANIAAAPRPATEVDNDVRNVFRLKLGVGGEETKGSPVIRVESSIAAHSGEARDIDIDLPGVVIDYTDIGEVVEAVRSLYSRLAVRLAWPRRVWSMDVAMGQLVTLALGDTVAVSHPDLLGDSGRLGTATAYGTVSEISGSLWDATGTIRVTSYGAPGLGWAPAAQVATVPSTTTVTVTANLYTPTVHPVTGAALNDSMWLDALAAGTIVRHRPRGNMAGTVNLPAISSVNTGTRLVTFSGAHGMSVNDDIVPGAWAAADGYLASNGAYIGRVSIV